MGANLCSAINTNVEASDHISSPCGSYLMVWARSWGRGEPTATVEGPHTSTTAICDFCSIPHFSCDLSFFLI